MFFLDKRYFSFCYYFISKKWLYRLPKGFVVCDVTCLNVTKEFPLFTPNQTYTEIALLITCLSINITYKRRLICLNIPAFYGSMSLNSLIKSCFKSIKGKILVLRSHLNNTIFNVKHKRFIRKVFIIPISHNICFLFFTEYFHYC